MTRHDISPRVPPWSQEAEQSVLGGLLIDNSALDRCADIVSEKDFHASHHRAIFGAMVAMIRAGQPADVITVFEALQRDGKADDDRCGLVYLNALAQSVPSAANARRYAEIVAEHAASRRIIAAVGKADEVAWSGKPAREAADQLATLFADLQQGHVRSVPRRMGDLLAERIDHWEALADGKKQPGMSSGLDHLDAALNGGLRPGMVYVLAARPSVGKTSLALAIMLAMARAGHTGCLLSQEMPSEECVDRAVSNLGAVDYGHLQTGIFTDNDEWSRVIEGVEALGNLPIFIEDQAGMSLGDIRAKATVMRREGLRVLGVDYLQLCSYEVQRGQTEASAIATISKGLKRLAKDLRIAVLLLSQLNREVERRASPEPTLSDLRDSGAIEQDADAVFGLWRVRTLGARQVMALTVLKNRQGRAGVRLALEFEGHYQRWHQSHADINPEPKPKVNTKGFSE